MHSNDSSFLFSFPKRHPHWYQFFLLVFITLLVYLTFRYLLPLFAPFLIAYLLMRSLYPIAQFLRNKWHFPSWLSYTTTLSAFFLLVGGSFLFLAWQLCRQIKLLFCNFPVYYQLWQQTFSVQSQKLCHCLDAMLSMESGTSMTFFDSHMDKLIESCNQLLSSHAGSALVACLSGSVHFFAAILIIIISMIVLCKDMELIHTAYKRSSWHKLLHQIAGTLKRTGLAYLKSQCIIIAAIWLVCGIGLFFIGNPYGVILGLAIALFDAFPVLGSGMILVPWSIYYVFQGNYFSAAILLTVLVLNIFLREILEAKLMGNNMGLIPLAMMASIYVGIYLFGVTGIFLGPFGAILIRTIYTLVQHPDTAVL